MTKVIFVCGESNSGKDTFAALYKIAKYYNENPEQEDLSDLASQIKHINNFSKIKDQKDWGKNYIEPYNPKITFDSIIQTAGFETVAPNSYHYGKDAHSFFNRFMLQYIITNKFI